MSDTMILPNRIAIAVADACNRDTSLMPVFLRTTTAEDYAKVPMFHAVLALREEVAADTRRQEHAAKERAACLKR